MKPVFQLRPFGALVPCRSVSLYLAPSASRQPVSVSPGSTGAAVTFVVAVFAGAAFAGAAALTGAFAGVLVCADVSICTVTTRSAQNAAVAAAIMLRVISQSSSLFVKRGSRRATLGDGLESPA